MRNAKLATTIILTAALFALAGCSQAGEPGEAVGNTTTQQESRTPTEPQPQSTQAGYLTEEPHPFATALREYMASYDGVVRAYLAILDGTANQYSYLPGRLGLLWGENAQTITRQEFEDIRARYGLDSLRHWTTMADETAQILALTN